MSKKSEKFRNWIDYRRLIATYHVFRANPDKVLLKKDFVSCCKTLKTQLFILEVLGLIERLEHTYKNSNIKRKISGWKLCKLKKE